MAYFAPGNSLVTASAMTCAVECRSTSRPSGVAGVTIASFVSCSSGRLRSSHCPSARAAIASLARRLPMLSATCADVVPRSYSRLDPSGSVTVMHSRSLIAERFYEWDAVRFG
jgi:hypothetical protein